MDREFRLAFDVGGTFTDVALVNEATRELFVNKVPTTPRDIQEGVINGIEGLLSSLKISPKEVVFMVHGSTVATNALHERKGAKTALITTKNFRDILELGRLDRPYYSFFLKVPEHLVPRRLRRGVTERTASDGKIITPIDLLEVGDQLDKLSSEGVSSVAVCYLNSYVNHKHEEETLALAAERHPELSVSVSSEIAPEWREYERMSTTVINAYVAPAAKKYLEGIRASLTKLGCRGPLYIMESNGGLMALETAIKYPVRMVESGPAAGVTMAEYLGSEIGLSEIISYDMGGTTAKACLIAGGRARISKDFEFGSTKRWAKGMGLPIKTPMIDLIEIGSGGGSIVTLRDGSLKVGPQSAGADPGPICYGTGGDRITVSDSDLVLGYLNPSYFLGGKLQLFPDLALSAMRTLAKEAEMTTTDLAWSIHRVVNEDMARALKVVSVEAGQDPKVFTLIAFGGAGGVHACRLAQSLGIPRVVVPLAAGVTSAYGMLVSELRFDFSKTFITQLRDLDVAHVNALYAEMERAAVRVMNEGAEEDRSIRYVRSADMRYVGQGFDIETSVPSGELEAASTKKMERNFHDEYERIYGYTSEDVPVEVINWRLKVFGEVKPPRLREYATGSSKNRGVKGKREVYMPERHDYVECEVYDRYSLMPGQTIRGPVVVEERESTTVLIPGTLTKVDRYQNLVIKLDG